MYNGPKAQLLLAAALVTCMLAVVPEPASAGCKNSGGQIGNHKFSSQVVGSSVNICATAKNVLPARTVSVVTKPAVSGSITAKYRTEQKAINAVRKVAAKSTAVKISLKPKPKTTLKKIASNGVVSLTDSSALFTPAVPRIRVIPSQELSVAETASFSASSVTHFRSGLLLKVPTEVRFTPVDFAWTFGDGELGSAKSVKHSYFASGEYSVFLSVRFSIAYRVRGSGRWISEPDQIQMGTDVSMRVVSSEDISEPAAKPEGRVVLVGSNCNEKPAAVGCR